MTRSHVSWRFFEAPAPPPLATCRSWSGRQGDAPEHDHAFVEVVLITAGIGVNRCARGDLPLAAGSFLVIRPGAWHAYRGCRDLAGFDLCLVEPAVRQALPAAFADPLVAGLLMGAPSSSGHRGVLSGTIPADGLPACAEAFARLEKLHRFAASHETERLGCLLVALGRLAQAAALAEPGPARAHDPAMEAAARLLQREPDRPWDVRSLGRSVGLGPGPLGTRFKRALGLPPMAWLHRHRIELAAALLTTTDRPIGSIGAAVGWSDANLFARRFRAATGLTPSAHRSRFRRPVAERAEA
jgi:AraC family L-rhamnose operon transcriptional activator RhaR